MNQREMTYAAALNEALKEEMTRDERVFVMGEDIGLLGGVYKVTDGLLDQFGPERVRQTPISEACIVGMAIGAAMLGLRPVAEIMYVDFMGLAMDQVVNQAAKLRYMSGGSLSCPMVVRMHQGTGRGNAAQHSQCLEAWFCHIPGIDVVIPSTPRDAKGLLCSAIHNANPTIFLEHKLLYYTKGPVPDAPYTIPFGKAEIKREGKDVTCIAWSKMVGEALKAADILAARGIEVEVVDPRTLQPLDYETLFASVEKTGRCVILEEACRRGSVGADIAASISEEMFSSLDWPVTRLSSMDTPKPFNGNLEEYTLPNAEKLVAAIEAMQ